MTFLVAAASRSKVPPPRNVARPKEEGTIEPANAGPRVGAGVSELHKAFIAEVGQDGYILATGEPLARHTTFRIGGPADLYAAATSTAALEQLAGAASRYELPVTVLGGGSNMLVSDAGVRGLVIANQTRELREVWDGHLPAGRLPQVVADSGVALAGLARWSIRAGWSGLEWAVSVPGTVGGAIVGNAGAHGGQMADSLAWALVFTPGSAGRQVLTGKELEFSYRSSALKRRLAGGSAAPVVLAAGFQLVQGNAQELSARAEAFLARRRAAQPVEPSAGSIFRNPPGDHAGRLVEEAGLKGYRIGGALISPRHANFIINDAGHARAADVLALIELVRARVLKGTGLELVPEIVFVGDWPAQPPYAALAAT